MRSGRRGLSWVAAAVLLVGVPAAGTAVASNPSSPTVRHRDKVWKYSFLRFDDWAPIPLESQEGNPFRSSIGKHMVARFVQKDDYVKAGRFVTGSIGVFRMGGPAAETTGETPRGVRVPSDDEPKTMRELLASIAEQTGGVALLDPKKAKDIKSKDGIPGKLWTVDRSERAARDRGVQFMNEYMLFATWQKDDVEMGLCIICDALLRKKFETGFGRVISSFTWFDDKAEDVQSLDVLNGLRISAKKRRQIEKGLVAGWDVLVSPSKNYIVIYNRKGRRNDRLARTLAERIEAIRAQVYELQFPPAKPIEAVSIVRVCGDEEEYLDYGGPYGSAGYWSDRSEELVFYDANPKDSAPDDDTLAVCYHEAFHQYIYYSVGKVAPHSWFNEGHGDYYAGSRFGGSRFTVRPFNWRVKRVKDAIKAGPCPFEERTDEDGSRFKFDRSNHGYTPLKALVRLSQSEYYSYASISYAQGWSLVYFLREIVPKNKDWNAKWGNVLETYFTTLKTEVNKDTPLVPKTVDPDEGGDDPGMDDPEPGTGEPTPPGMGEPTPPGMGDDPTPPGDDEPPEVRIAIGIFGNEGNRKALKRAADEAFKGVDFDELEAAWKKEILKIPDPPKRP